MEPETLVSRLLTRIIYSRPWGLRVHWVLTMQNNRLKRLSGREVLFPTLYGRIRSLLR